MALIHRSTDGAHKLADVARLGENALLIETLEPCGLRRIAGTASQHDHSTRHGRLVLFEPPHQPIAAELRHRQVRHDRVVRARLEELDRFGAVGGLRDVERLYERARKRSTKVDVIVNEQDAWAIWQGHVLPSVPRFRRLCGNRHAVISDEMNGSNGRKNNSSYNFIYGARRARQFRAVRPLDPERVCRNVGRRIAELRKERGMTQEEFSVILGTSFQWVSQLESGRNMTLHSLARVANALHVSLEALLALPTAASRVRRAGRPRKVS